MVLIVFYTNDNDLHCIDRSVGQIIGNALSKLWIACVPPCLVYGPQCVIPAVARGWAWSLSASTIRYVFICNASRVLLPRSACVRNPLPATPLCPSLCFHSRPICSPLPRWSRSDLP